jgi:hypothetical protein
MSASTLKFTKNSFYKHFIGKQTEDNIWNNTKTVEINMRKIPSLAQASLEEEELEPEEHSPNSIDCFL